MDDLVKNKRPIRPCPFCFASAAQTAFDGNLVFVKCWSCLAESSKLERYAFVNDDDARDAVIINWNAISIIILGEEDF